MRNLEDPSSRALHLAVMTNEQLFNVIGINIHLIKLLQMDFRL